MNKKMMLLAVVMFSGALCFGAEKQDLVAAARQGHADVVRGMLSRGVAITPQALEAAILKDHEEVVKLLLDNGANVNARIGLIDRNTPLMKAVETASPSMVKLLLDRGADVHVKNNFGMTALSLAKARERSRLDSAKKAQLKKIVGYLEKAEKKQK